jgi:hypothetical protein
VHGYIRVIAAAVGADPKPLIEEYDSVPRRPADAQAAAVDEIPPAGEAPPAAGEAPPAVEDAPPPAEQAQQSEAGEAHAAAGEVPQPATAKAPPASEKVQPPAGEASTPEVPVPTAPAQTTPAKAATLYTAQRAAPGAAAGAAAGGAAGPAAGGAAGPVAAPARVRRQPALTRMPARVRLNRAGWWRRAAWITALALAVLAVLGTAGHAILSSLNHKGVTVTAKTDPAVTRHASKPTAAPSKTSSGGVADPSRHAPARPAHARAHTAPAHAVPARVLAPVSAEAFGPYGAADGDNPQGAASVIDGGQGTPWKTDWYTTAAFGDLKEGTGLLLDLGGRMTITNAEVVLGGIPGADLQLRVGDSPVLSLLRPVAGASGASGATWLRLTSPVRARYVLIWFTRLPPDTSGTYQASLYGVRLTGQP